MSQVLVHEMVVPQSDLDAEEPWALMEANCRFLDRLSGVGLLEESEFCPDCRMLYYICNYCGQVRNGGHEQFIGNKGWKSDINDLIYAGLRRIGADHFADLFQEVRTYVDADDQRLAGMKIRGGFRHPTAGQVDDWMSGKDSEFYALNRANDLLGIGSNFLRRHPALIVVPDAEWSDRIQKIADRNPYLGQRLAERKRAHEERQRAYRRKLMACEEAKCNDWAIYRRYPGHDCAREQRRAPN